MVLDLPAAFAVDVLTIATHYLVAHNVKVVAGLVTEELFEQRTNDRLHAGGQDDNGDIVLSGPVVKLLEVWVQLHVLQQRRDTLVVGGLDARKHLTEGVTGMEERTVSASSLCG